MIETKIERKLVGDKILISVYDIEKTIAEALLEEAYNYALKLEKVFNFYDKNSELSNLNKKRTLKVSKDLLYVLSNALEYSKLSLGGYDVSIGKNILQRKSGEKITILGCSYKNIKIEGDIVSLTHEDVLIDLGSIAKGYIADKISDFLKSKGVEEGFIDARGDLVIFGKHAEIVNIQHPRDKTKNVLPLKLNNISIATSGDYNQFNKNFTESHILNKKEIISASVVASNAMQADAFATLIMTTEKKLREKILSKNPDIKALLIDANLKQKDYNGFLSLIYANKDKK